MILVYIDDIIIIRNNDDFTESTIHKLSQEFTVKYLRRLHYFLGLEIKYIIGGVF